MTTSSNHSIRALTIALACSTAVVIGGSACARETQGQAADVLRRDLEKVSRVEFYFMNSTSDAAYSVKDFTDRASVQVKRKCGGNCARFMREVIQHFQDAKPRPCDERWQNVMILMPGGSTIIYSYGGRHIRYRGQCYFNEKRVNHIIERSNFLFLGSKACSVEPEPVAEAMTSVNLDRNKVDSP